MKFESEHRNRLSNKISDDAEAAKVITDELCGEFGYLQEIGLNPFGVLMMCDLQVKLKIFNIYIIYLQFFNLF